MLDEKDDKWSDMTPRVQDEIRRFTSGLTLNEGNFGIYLCICDSEEEKQVILDELAGEDTVITSNTPEEQHLMMHKLAEGLDQEQQDSANEKRKKFVLIPNADFESEEYGNLWRFTCHRLNEWRENLRLNHPNHLVFILNSKAFDIMMREAADFYSVRQGTYDLTDGPE